MSEQPDAPDEPDDDDEVVDLTPEQRAQLKATMDAIRRSIAPKINFDISNFAGLAKINSDLAKLGRVSSLSFKPFLKTQNLWAKPFKASNSDFFKANAANQAQFANLSAKLTRNVEFGLGKSISKITQQFAAQQASMLKGLSPILANLKFTFYPRNLRDIEGLLFKDVETIVMADGIALYGVPRAATAEALIRADDAAERRAILGSRWKAISADCRVALTACETDVVASYLPFGLEALDALDAGHELAAQALVGSLIDALVNGYFGAERRDYTPNKRTTTTAAYEEFSIREFIAMAPIWQAYQQFVPGAGGRVPTTFSRHATAHTMSSKQYSRRNAVQGLLLACSLIYFFNEQAST